MAGTVTGEIGSSRVPPLFIPFWSVSTTIHERKRYREEERLGLQGSSLEHHGF